MDDSTTLLAHWLHEAAKKLERVEGAGRFSLEADELARRSASGDRLVAVFGAFSAGKSSLINALVGDDALTVSPNPTTATVTELHYPAEGEEPGSCRIEFKSSDELFEDVKFALVKIHRSANNLEDGLKLATQLKLTDVPKSARRFLLFLKSVASGYEDAREKLGTTVILPKSEAMRYTSEERLAGFVNRVQLAHASDLLKGGLTLVDTPGVDSIHKRHTNVAFDYMRKADAVVFVTYYSHAFTRADKDFLAQLSGVQDIASHNKMFVVINAVDLAKDDEDQSAVRKRVELELRQSGLSHIPIYEVSSQLTLLARKRQENPDNEDINALLGERLKLSELDSIPDAKAIQELSGTPAFASGMSTLMATQSGEMLSQAAHRLRQSMLDWLKRRKTILASQLTMSTQEQQALHEKRYELSDRFEAIRSLCEEAMKSGAVTHEAEDLASVNHGLIGIQTEAKELIHHAGNRLRFDLAQMVREAFHPGRFVATGQTRRVLEDAAEELATWLGRRWLVEQRNLVLRMGHKSLQLVDAIEATWEQKLETVGASLAVRKAIDKAQWQDELLTAFPEDDSLLASRFDKALRHFSSPKQFFEGTGQSDLLADVEASMNDWLNTSSQAVVQSLLQLVSRQVHGTLSSFCHIAAEAARMEEVRASSTELEVQQQMVSGALEWVESNSNFS